MTSPRRAVLSLLNTPAGLFRWYEEFPLQIGERLAEEGIEHVIGYKEYLPHSIMPASPRLTLHDETEMPDPGAVERKLAPIMERYDQLIVHTHSYGFRDCKVWRLTRGHGQRRWWATAHVTPRPGRRVTAMARRTLQTLRTHYPDRIFGVSETTAAPLRKMFRRDSVGVVLNGRLSAEQMRGFPERELPRRALFVGRLTPEKGVWPLLEAGARLARAYPDFRLCIVGEGPSQEAMAQWITARGLDDRITMAGYRSDVQPYFAAADYLVVPTDPALFAEGLSLVAIEAKACALPVLYTRSGGLPESQLEGVTGLLLDPPDADHIVAAASALMDDPLRYRRMREAIREERVRWAQSRMVDDYVAEYLSEFRRMTRIHR